MWIWAIFDLPVVSKEERKIATGFRKRLLDLGFEMVQFSVYSRYTISKEKADAISEQISRSVPDNGKIDLLYFTDKQYSQIRSFRCDRESTLAEKPDQFVLF